MFIVRSLPIDYSSYRHTGLNGQLSRSVTTVIPQNPFNYMDISSTTTNASIDSRPHVLMQQLPGKKSTPLKVNNNNEKIEEHIDNNPV
jgi:hypothetical protein